MIKKEVFTVRNSQKEVVLSGVRYMILYVVSQEDCPPEPCLVSKSNADTNWLWHRKLSHLNFKTINKLAKHKLVEGLPSIVFQKNQTCGACQRGQQTRASFKSKTAYSTDRVLQLLHMDLLRPISPRSCNGRKYTLVIVDDFSRFTWVLFMHKKSETLEKLPTMLKKLSVEKQTDVVNIRSDRGTEFLNVVIRKYCDTKGINHQTSAARIPQQNGVAERRNRTLKEVARTMLADSSLPLKFWTEAANTTCYTQN